MVYHKSTCYIDFNNGVNTDADNCWMFWFSELFHAYGYMVVAVEVCYTTQLLRQYCNMQEVAKVRARPSSFLSGVGVRPHRSIQQTFGCRTVSHF